MRLSIYVAADIVDLDCRREANASKVLRLGSILVASPETATSPVLANAVISSRVVLRERVNSRHTCCSRRVLTYRRNYSRLIAWR